MCFDVNHEKYEEIFAKFFGDLRADCYELKDCTRASLTRVGDGGWGTAALQDMRVGTLPLPTPSIANGVDDVCTIGQPSRKVQDEMQELIDVLQFLL